MTETPEFIGLDEFSVSGRRLYHTAICNLENRGTSRSQAQERLRVLEKTMSDGSLSEFKELLHTLDNWREEILNYFDYPITNGFVEGKNNRIKTIKRTAYGYRNMDNFRLRILATNFKGAR